MPELAIWTPGIRHLRIAQTEAPGDPVIASNLATALAQQGSYAAALDLLTEEVAAKDPSFRLQRMRAFFAQEAGDHGIAIPAYEKIVSRNPRTGRHGIISAISRRMAGDAEGSVAALEKAVGTQSLIAAGPPELRDGARRCRTCGRSRATAPGHGGGLSSGHQAPARTVRDLQGARRERKKLSARLRRHRRSPPISIWPSWQPGRNSTSSSRKMRR